MAEKKGCRFAEFRTILTHICPEGEGQSGRKSKGCRFSHDVDAFVQKEEGTKKQSAGWGRSGGNGFKVRLLDPNWAPTRAPLTAEWHVGHGWLLASPGYKKTCSGY